MAACVAAILAQLLKIHIQTGYQVSPRECFKNASKWVVRARSYVHEKLRRRMKGVGARFFSLCLALPFHSVTGTHTHSHLLLVSYISSTPSRGIFLYQSLMILQYSPESLSNNKLIGAHRKSKAEVYVVWCILRGSPLPRQQLWGKEGLLRW